LQSGAVSVQSAPLAPVAEPVRLLIAKDVTQADNVFLRHKSSMRARYDAGWRDAESQGAFDTLFFNEQGELTEGGRSNVFIKLNGQWLTPPLVSGVLPGVMRSVLLTDPAWGAQERVIMRDMLNEASEIVVCNALRGPLRSFV
jgi:para-aminobenzoate synthetase/4-amino-4-deoxychorismate lyase